MCSSCSYDIIIFRRIDERQLIVDIEKDCLAEKAGIQVWDIVEELCNQPIHLITGNVSNRISLDCSVSVCICFPSSVSKVCSKTLIGLY